MSVGRLQLMMKVVLNGGEWLGIRWVFVKNAVDDETGIRGDI